MPVMVGVGIIEAADCAGFRLARILVLGKSCHHHYGLELSPFWSPYGLECNILVHV